MLKKNQTVLMNHKPKILSTPKNTDKENQKSNQKPNPSSHHSNHKAKYAKRIKLASPIKGIRSFAEFKESRQGGTACSELIAKLKVLHLESQQEQNRQKALKTAKFLLLENRICSELLTQGTSSGRFDVRESIVLKEFCVWWLLVNIHREESAVEEGVPVDLFNQGFSCIGDEGIGLLKSYYLELVGDLLENCADPMGLLKEDVRGYIQDRESTRCKKRRLSLKSKTQVESCQSFTIKVHPKPRSLGIQEITLRRKSLRRIKEYIHSINPNRSLRVSRHDAQNLGSPSRIRLKDQIKSVNRIREISKSPVYYIPSEWQTSGKKEGMLARLDFNPFSANTMNFPYIGLNRQGLISQDRESVDSKKSLGEEKDRVEELGANTTMINSFNKPRSSYVKKDSQNNSRSSSGLKRSAYDEEYPENLVEGAIISLKDKF